MPDTPVRILPELRYLSAEELAAEVRSLRTGQARNLPVRLSASAARTIAASYAAAPPGSGQVGDLLATLAHGQEVSRAGLIVDVLAVIALCEEGRPSGVTEEEDVDVQHLRLLREWAETQP